MECNHPSHSHVKIKRLHKAHNYLCEKNKHYHNWHHHKHHKKVHFGILALCITTIFGLILSSIFSPITSYAANTTTSWDINTAGDYTYNSSKIEFSNGVAQLKGNTFSATGGTITTSGAYTIHTFTTGGTFTPANPMNVEVLVVAGGGSGGGSTAGGGGAGGLIYNATYLVGAGSTIVTVGDGGAQAMEQTAGNSGQNSIFGSLTAIGGGGGGFTSTGVGGVGKNGGSGGGGAMYGGKSFSRGTGTPGQGNDGGTFGSDSFPGGGGGGAGASGAAPTASKSGNGGIGLSYSISGSPVYYAGGGGGGSVDTGGDGGQGGGGAGTSDGTTGTPGAVNTGGGGGGGWLYSGGRGGAGGSGIAIIRYLTTAYTSDNPTLVSTVGQAYSSLSSFTETSGAGSTGTIKYQISPDNGTKWYWYTGGFWTETSTGYAEANTAAEIDPTHDADPTNDNDPINNFTTGSSPKTFKWKAFFISDGSQQPKLDNISLQFAWDTAAPPNPTIGTAKDSNGGTEDLVSGSWHNYSSPYFTWQPVVDIANEGETPSGTAGYYVYFGEDPTGLPKQARGIATELGSSGGKHFQLDTNFEVGVDTSPLETGKTYYLRITAVDNAGNPNGAGEVANLFTYKFDGNLPSNPALFSASPTGWFRAAADIPAFSWPTSGGNRATDTGGSIILGYQYRINSGVWYGLSHTGLENKDDIILFTTGSYTLCAEYDYDSIVDGENTFEIRTWDNAGNYSNKNEPIRTLKTIFNYNASAPTAVRDLSANPPTRTINSFDFTWSEPLSYNGSIDHYRYYVNNDSDSDQIYTTQGTTVTSIRARVRGNNTFYIQAVDNANNAGDLAYVSFYADTSAPTAPRSVEMIDASSRDLNQFKISLNWLEPEDMGAGFVGYDIYRSNDGNFYSFLSTTTQPFFTDSNLNNTYTYYYQIKARDNALQSSPVAQAKKQGGLVLYIMPTGRFANAPEIIEQKGKKVNVQVKAFSVTASWTVERNVDEAFVECGSSKDKIGEASGGLTAVRREKTDNYNIKLDGLEPSEPGRPRHYYCHVVWNDSGADISEGKSEIFEFDTSLRPTIDLPKADNITIDSAKISWTSKNIINASVEFCPENNSICPEPIKDYSGPDVEDHSIQLYNLTDGTKYVYRIIGYDVDGKIVTSSRTDFITLARPRINTVRFETVPESPTTTVKVSWHTNVKTTSNVDYSFIGSPSVYHKSEAIYITEHEVLISDLTDQTTYTFTPKGVDEHGNQTINTDSQTFITPNDTRPPKLSDLTIEVRSSGVGAAQKSQALVSWISDEPGTSQVEYGPGISSDSYPAKSQEDAVYTTNHVVIVSGLDPAKLYHLRAISKDKSGNAGTSVDTTVITGKVQKSVVDLIMNSLQKSLGFLSKLSFLSR